MLELKALLMSKAATLLSLTFSPVKDHCALFKKDLPCGKHTDSYLGGGLNLITIYGLEYRKYE